MKTYYILKFLKPEDLPAKIIIINQNQISIKFDSPAPPEATFENVPKYPLAKEEFVTLFAKLEEDKDVCSKTSTLQIEFDSPIVESLKKWEMKVVKNDTLTYYAYWIPKVYYESRVPVLVLNKNLINQ